MRVFSFHDICFRNIPKPHSFENVAGYARDVLGKSESVYGALLLGSAAFGKASITSNIDILVVADTVENSELKCRVLLQDIGKYARFRHVPFTPIILPRELAQNGDHTITHSFMKHLRSAMHYGGYVKNDPLAKIYMAKKAPIARDVQYEFARKTQSILSQMASVYWPKGKLETFCGKILSLPSMLCLKMLYVMDPQYIEEPGKSPILAYRDLVKNSTLLDSLQLLTERKERYEDELQVQLKNPDEGSYASMLEHIRDVSSTMALIFLRRNIFLLDIYD